MGNSSALEGGVLQVVHGWPPGQVGGTELYVQALVEALASRVPCSVFAGSGTGGATVQDHLHGQVPVRRLAPPAPRTFRQTYRRPWVESVFVRWLALQRPRLVHFHHLAFLSTGLPRLAARHGALVVMTLHDYWMICARGQLMDRTGARCAGPDPRRCARCLGGQLGLTPMTAAFAGPSRVLPARLRAALRDHALARPGRRGVHAAAERIRDTRAAAGWVQHFLSPSTDLADRMMALGLPIRQIHHAPLPLVQPVSPLPAPPPGPVRFLFIGTLIASKGPDLLLEAFARLPAGAASLRLVGPAVEQDQDPAYFSRLARRVTQLPGVELHQPFAPGEVQAWLRDADVLVVPSRWEENSPLVVREARAAGVRVIASRRGGIHELAPDIRFFEPDEPDTLLEALRGELRAGRYRLPPISYPSPDEHAADMFSRYSGWLTDGFSPRKQVWD